MMLSHCMLCVDHSFVVSRFKFAREARWPSGRASDTGARVWGSDPHSGVVLCPPKSTGNTQEAVAPSTT